jgi:hypothetical protein
MCLNKDFRKLNKFLVLISCILLTTGFGYQQEEAAMVFSADGKYTSEEKYVSVQVIESEVNFINSNLKYDGILFNPGAEPLDKIELVIDLYGEHDLIKELSMPIYQCKQLLGAILSAGESINFSGSCTILPENVEVIFKKHRISIGKQ